MNDLLGMKRYAKGRGLCGEFSGLWDAAASQKDLADMALRIDGVQFMAEGAANGWGLRPAYIRENFPGYVNGAYMGRMKGYTSEMWADYRGGDWIEFRATLALILGCDMRVRIHAGRVVDLHVSGGSCLDIECEGVAYMSVYGENDIAVKTAGKGRCVKRMVELPKDGSIRFVGPRQRG